MIDMMCLALFVSPTVVADWVEFHVYNWPNVSHNIILVGTGGLRSGDYPGGKSGSAVQGSG